MERRVVDRAKEIAWARGAKPAQVAQHRVLGKQAASAPSIGASKMYPLDDALAVLKIKLNAARSSGRMAVPGKNSFLRE